LIGRVANPTSAVVEVGDAGTVVVGATVVVGGNVVVGAAVVVGATVVLGATVVVGLTVVVGAVGLTVEAFSLLLLPPPAARPITVRMTNVATTQAMICFQRARFRKRRQGFGFPTAASGACEGCVVGPGESG
jgi:hypothetical protein